MKREQTGFMIRFVTCVVWVLPHVVCLCEDEGEWNGSNAGEGNGFNASYS